MALLTVGLPVCNSMPYLREAMESLLAQTSSDFKILAIVDHCGDGSVEYMRSLKDDRLQFIFQARSGLIPTLNRMLREAGTPWLMRHDADDVAYPRRVERTLEFIRKYPNAGIFTSFAEYYPPSRSLGRFRSTRGTPEELREFVRSGYLLTFCHPSATLNVQKTLEIGAYSETLQHAEDADLWWRMALPYDIQIIPEVLLGYRHHARQATTRGMKQNVVDLLYVQYLLLSRLWSLAPRTKEEVRPLLEQYISTGALTAKDGLRLVNIRAASSDFAGAIISAFSAFVASPHFVLTRLWDELAPNRVILNGINPSHFARRKSEFWTVPPEPPEDGSSDLSPSGTHR
jgi:glycosyltransferase involved in cell wall biosynthesis